MASMISLIKMRTWGLLGLILAATAVPSSLAQASTSSEQPGAQASVPVPSIAPGVTLQSQHVDLTSMPFDTVQVGLVCQCPVDACRSCSVCKRPGTAIFRHADIFLSVDSC